MRHSITAILLRLQELLAHQGLRRYAGNTAWLFAEQALRMLAGFLVGVWVARYLGAGNFGIFSYALAFTSIFGGLAKLGLDSIVVRELIKTPEKRDVCLGTAFRLKLVGAFLTLLAVALAVVPSGNDATTNIYILIIAAGVVFQSFEVVDFYFQSQVLSKFVSVCKMSQTLFSSLFKIYFVLTGADLIWFVLVTLFDQILLGLSLALAYKLQRLGSFYRQFDMALARQMLGDSWPLILASVGTMLLFRIDQLLIKSFLGMEAVGLYAAAVKIAELWFFIPMIITSSLFPAIVNARKISPDLCNQRLMRLYSLLIWISLGIAVVVTLFSGWLMATLFGHAYAPAGDTLAILSWSAVFVFLGNASKRWFLVENLQRLLLYRIVGGVGMNVVLNLILIPLYGIEGAAISTLVSYGFTYYISYLFNPRLRELFVITTKSFCPKYIFKEAYEDREK